MPKNIETVEKLKFLPKLPDPNDFRRRPRQNTKRKMFVEALRSRPGLWAQYPFKIRTVHCLATQLRKKHGLEAVVSDGRVFARFPGGRGER